MSTNTANQESAAMFTIKACRGQYLRATMTEATTRQESRMAMYAALRYLGAEDPKLVTWEDGSIAGYYTAEDAEADDDGSTPALLATIDGTEEE